MKYKIHLILLVLFMETVFAGGAISLKAAMSLALEHNAAIKVQKLQVDAADAVMRQESLLPNPEMEIEVEDFGKTEGLLLISQEIELGGKRKGRVRVAGVQKDLAGLEYEVKRLEVLAQTVTAYINVWETQEKARYWQESVKLADSVLAIISHRVREGASPLVEEIRAEVELSNTRMQARASAKDLLTAKAALTAIWAPAQSGFESVGGELYDKGAKLDTNILFQLLEQCPQMKISKVFGLRQQAELKLARAERFTNVALAAGIKRDMQAGDNAAIIGVTFGLPIFNRNQGGVMEAELGQKTSQLEAGASQNELRRTLRALAADYDVYKNEVTALKDISVPKIELAFAEVTKLYQHGKASYLDLLDTRRALLDARVMYVEALAQVNKIKVEIDALTGQDIKDANIGGN